MILRACVNQIAIEEDAVELVRIPCTICGNSSIPKSKKSFLDGISIDVGHLVVLVDGMILIACTTFFGRFIMSARQMNKDVQRSSKPWPSTIRPIFGVPQLAFYHRCCFFLASEAVAIECRRPKWCLHRYNGSGTIRGA
ncbi:MAG: hypothetical protein ACI9G1_000836 [Pirellulaceae bacterium]|jgi:hypothetical protein